MSEKPVVTMEKREHGWRVLVLVSARPGVAFRNGDKAHVIAGQTAVRVEKRKQEYAK